MAKRNKKPISLQPVVEKEKEYSITDTLSLQVLMPGGVQAKVGRGGLTIASEGNTNQDGRAAPPPKTVTKKKSDKDQKQLESLLEQPQRETYRFEDLKIGEVIGEGSQAKVRRVKHDPTNKLLALKIISFGAGMTRKVLQTELSRCSSVDKHPNLVSSLEAYFKEGFLMVLMEFMAYGTLQSVTKKVVEKGQRVPEDVLSKIASQILAGLNHLHTGGGTGNGLIHRDLKPSNVLVNSEGQVKISDFGVATFLSSHNQMAFTSVGSTAYMSPERVRGDGYNTASDIWAVGVSLAEIAIGHFPIGAIDQRGNKNDELFGLCVIIAENRSAVIWPEGVHFSDEFKDFVAQCMQQKPEDRPSAAQLMDHPFIKKYENVEVDLAGWFKAIMDKDKKEKKEAKQQQQQQQQQEPVQEPVS